MIIEWNKVTWYSKILAVALFVGTFWVAFCLGTKYERATNEFVRPGITENLQDNQPASGGLRIKVGENKSLGNFRISLDSVSGDSRCPADVQCIWAGNVKVKATFSYDGNIKTVDLSLDDETEFLGFKVTIREVYPAPKGGVKIDPKDYEAVFDIVKI